MIAEVHRISGMPSTEPADPSIADEVAKTEGTEELITMVNADTGEGLVVHLWRDREAYDAFAARRAELTAQVQEGGQTVAPAEFYDVTYHS